MKLSKIFFNYYHIYLGPNHPMFWGEDNRYNPNEIFPPGYPQPRFDPIHPSSIDPMGGGRGGRGYPGLGGRGRGRGRGARLFPGEPDPDNLHSPQFGYDDDDLYS